jgi:AcrR family transcriptional regulator
LKALSLRNLAERRGLNVTRTAPLHYYGSSVGLLGAVAECGFSELTLQLRAARESGESPEQAIKALGLSYASYALQNEHLYRAMHASDLWHAATIDQSSQRGGSKAAAAKARYWIEQAIDARNGAFAEFVDAVQKAQAAGRLRDDAGEQAGNTANFITAIVDGFLFQHFDERVTESWTTEECLQKLERFLDIAMDGLRVSH